MQAIEQYKSMIQAGKMPVFEYRLSNNDWLTVHIAMTDTAVVFSFDLDGMKYNHDGDIRKLYANNYLLPLDPHFEDLDYYLQAINESITEDYLLYNNLLPVD